MTTTTSARCYIQTAASPPSLIQNGHIVFQLHIIGWLVAASFTLVATLTSAWLIGSHLRWYTNKSEQRYIVRILFLVPIYAIVSFASYLFWNQSTPLLLIRDCYESIVLTAFFYLLLMYLSHDPEEQRIIFAKHGLSHQADDEARARGEPVKKWFFPLQSVKWKPRDGLYFLQLMKYGILQYAVIRPVTTLIAIVLNYLGLYCASSWSPRWGYIYLSLIVSISVTIAMYCLIQLYLTVSKPLAPHQPLLKMISIKAVVFLTFWQASFISLLSTFGVIKNTTYMTANDIDIGIGALVETFEMMLFAFFHIKAFSYLPYKRSPTSLSKEMPPQPTPRLHSLYHAMDFRETCKELWAGCVYLFDKARGREPSADRSARRAGYYENAFARPRIPQRSSPRATEKASSSRSPAPRSKSEKVPFPPKASLYVQVEREVDVDGERQWLGTGDDYIYGLDFMHRDRNDGLQLEFERELVRRGYAPSRTLPQQPFDPDSNRYTRPKDDSRTSWWRSFYRRLSLSQSDRDTGEQVPSPPPKPRRQSRSRRSPRSSEQNALLLTNLEDLPPRSILGTYQRQQKEEQKNHSPRGTDDGDVLMPLPVFQDSRFAGLSSPSRSSHRQTPPLGAVDRESTSSSSSPAPKHPFPSVEGSSQGFLAPVSSRASRYSRDDSLLGRLFHDTMTEGDSISTTDFGTIGDGTQSILSMSTDGVGQAKKTPRARLATTTPQIITRGTMIDAAGRRALLQPVPEQTRPSPELAGPLAAELLVPDLTNSLDQTQGLSEERRASIHRRPLPTPPTSAMQPSPTAHSPWTTVGDVGRSATRTIRHHTSRDDLDILPQRRPLADSHDLRRSNARARPRAMTGPPEMQRFATVHSHEVPWVPEQTHGRRDAYDQPSPGYSSPGSISPGQTTPSQMSGVLPRLVTQPKKTVSAARDIGYQPSSEARGYNHSGTPRSSPPSPESRTMPSRHKARNPPSPQSRANSSRHSLSSPHSRSQTNPPPSPSSPRALRPHHDHSAKSFTTTNRPRKHHEGKHGRSSSSNLPASPSRTSQVTSSTSRSPTSLNTNGSSYTPRTWRTVDYPSTSWYLPANPDRR